MSRTELMAAIALAAGLTLTIAKIATSQDGGTATAGAFDPADLLGWGSPVEDVEPLQLAENDLHDAY
ncbi:hypothetical protein [Rubellimicrobium arenae]|uniref:hypothetical protein n=1 Tax=Rubellimicrobium arenae TaxID=2817372 RepID=UPI001B30F5A0|nr:hypothetical protein [Rubellimicrobium arenae]